MVLTYPKHVMNNFNITDREINEDNFMQTLSDDERQEAESNLFGYIRTLIEIKQSIELTKQHESNQ